MNAVDTVLQNAVAAGDVSFAVAMLGNSQGHYLVWRSLGGCRPKQAVI